MVTLKGGEAVDNVRDREEFILREIVDNLTGDRTTLPSYLVPKNRKEALLCEIELNTRDGGAPSGCSLTNNEW